MVSLAALQEVDVNAELEALLSMMETKIESKGIIVERDYASDLPALRAYSNELSHALMHLLDNSIDAVAEKQDTIRISTLAEKGHLVVEIEDDGSGIPEVVQSRIFEPFFTTKGTPRRTGLGLSSAHRIVTRLHDGEIGVDSAPGKTRMRVRLPVIPS